MHPGTAAAITTSGTWAWSWGRALPSQGTDGRGEPMSPISKTPPALDVDGLLDDPARRSSCAAVPGAWGRPPRPPRSGCAPPSGDGTSSSSPWTRRAARPVDGPVGARQQPAQDRDRRRRRVARHDARHEADVRRDRRGARRPGPREADPRQPLLPVAVVQPVRDAGVHGDGEARAAAPVRCLGPDRRRHPTVPQRAGLPGRARADGPLPRRPLHEDPRGARPRPAAASASR